MVNPQEIRKQLFAVLDKAHRESHLPLHLHFLGKPDQKVKINFVNQIPMAQLSEAQIEKFNKIDQDAIRDKLQNDDHRKSYGYSHNGVKKAILSNAQITLNAICGGYFGPLYQDERKTMHFNAYTSLSFSIEELKILLYDIDHLSFIKDYNNDFISINDLAKKLSPENNTNNKEEDEAPDNSEDQSIDTLVTSRNIIFFGPPGTGKSYQINENAKNINVEKENIVRTVFYPEYSYYDFVGQYRPVVGYEVVSSKISDSNGKPLKDQEGGYKKPFVYYDFVPGPLIKAVVIALKLLDQEKESKENALLVIEEINRGNCATIFGNIFQLLDRINNVNNKNDDLYGRSEYSVDISLEVKNYIKDELKWQEDDWAKKFKDGFYLPSNLFIYATMNTSDQSLYPMDTAFKRRWMMEYVSIKYKEESLDAWTLPEPYSEIKWLEFIKVINKKIVQYTRSDDKQIGQRFIDGELNQEEFKGKILSYLWFDIFRHDPSIIFKEEIVTYDLLIENYDKGVIKSDIIEEMKQR